jgi:hypothetical protein
MIHQHPAGPASQKFSLSITIDIGKLNGCVELRLVP